MTSDDGHGLLDRLSIAALAPEDALRPNRQDATAVLVLRALRRSTIPLVALGLIGALTTGDHSTAALATLTGPSEWWATLRSPLAGLALAVVVRVGVSVAALLLALPRVPSETAGRPGLRARWHAWVDRLQVARAYRSLRWTWGVRAVAIRRLGVRGRRLALAEPAMQISGAVLLLVWFVLILSPAGA